MASTHASHTIFTAVQTITLTAFKTSTLSQQTYLYWRIKQKPESLRIIFETLLTIYQSYRRHIPESSYLEIRWWSYFVFLNGTVVEGSEVSV